MSVIAGLRNTCSFSFLIVCVFCFETTLWSQSVHGGLAPSGGQDGTTGQQTVGEVCARLTPFLRSDANGDMLADMSDAIRTLDFIFLGTATLWCVDAADTNDDGLVDLSDAISSLNFQFLGGTPPPPPYPEPGLDPTEDAYLCQEFSSDFCEDFLVQPRLAVAPSRHYVEVELTGVVGSEHLVAANYSIQAVGLTPLAIVEVRSLEAGGVLLVTSSQEPVAYTLQFDRGGADAVTPESSISFQGSDRWEPYLLSATALDNTSVLVTFSEQVEKASTQDSSGYNITEQGAVNSLDIHAVESLSCGPCAGHLSQLTMRYDGAATRLVHVTELGAGGGETVIYEQVLDPGNSFTVGGATEGGALTNPIAFYVSGIRSSTLSTGCSDLLEDGSAVGATVRPGLAVGDFKVMDGLSSAGGQICPPDTLMNTTVLFTTGSQSTTDYEVTVLNIRAQTDGARIDPFRNIVSFQGQDEDLVAPKLTSAVATSVNTVLLSFDEALAEGADDPTNFGVSTVQDTNTTVHVLEASLSDHGTQITLTTSSLPSAPPLQVSASGVSDVAGNPIDVMSNEAFFVYDGSVDGERPTVVGAIAVSNTEVLVTFSEAMAGGLESAENPSHYRIYAVELAGNTLSATGELMVVGAELQDPPSVVRLTTLSQLGTTYKIEIVNVRDLHGEILVNPEAGDADPVDLNVTLFVGLPASGTPLDQDGDGISDADEQRGWLVVIHRNDGETESRWVTSDPQNPDTDGDGVTDNEEAHARTDPRSTDTDQDTISDGDEWNTVWSDPTNQDSDGDGIQDGFEFYTFRTSPSLRDTDGDGMDDADEILAGNRSPLLADLPVPGIRIGEISLSLETTLSETDESGQLVTNTQETALSSTVGSDQRFSTANETATQNTIESSLSAETGYAAGKDGGFSYKVSAGRSTGSSRGYTLNVSQETGSSAEETYGRSLGLEQTRDTRNSFTRDVLGGEIRATVFFENNSDVAFTLSNIELVALTQDPHNHRKLVPMGTLVSRAVTEGLEDFGTVNMGVLDDSGRGPFVFSSIHAFPEQIEALMKSPRGLIVRLSNYDLTDQDGENFAYSSQEILEKTAGITFDLGDGRIETYRVATSSAHHPVTAIPLGITMRDALTRIIGLCPNSKIRDGGNGIIETDLTGDDEDAGFGRGGGSIEPGEVIGTVGDNGELDSAPTGDDYIQLGDYETQEFVVSGVTKVGLSRFRDRANEVQADFDGTGDYASVWVLFSSKDLPRGYHLDNLILRAGDQLDFVYVEDRDNDGVWAREEYLHESSDGNADTDGDSLDDQQEIQEGWQVRLRGSPEVQQVYPNPVQPDSDSDSLNDPVEKGCLTDPRQQDTDLDGLTDFEEIFGVRINAGGTYSQMVTQDCICATTEDGGACTPHSLSECPDEYNPNLEQPELTVIPVYEGYYPGEEPTDLSGLPQEEYNYWNVVVDVARILNVVPPQVEGMTYTEKNEQGLLEYTHDSSGIRFVWLPGGSFSMGSPPGEAGRGDDEGPVHTVSLSPFLIAKYELTQAEYEAVMTGNTAGLDATPCCAPFPASFTGDNQPVGFVSWDDLHLADGFLERTGLSLPSEAQWEYACRAGTSGPFAGTGNLDDMGWYTGNTSGTTEDVGGKLANQFGLHDMHGNIYEWCEDFYKSDFYADDVPGLDPVSTTGSGDRRVYRGGEFVSSSVGCRSAFRFFRPPGNRNVSIGVRPAFPAPEGHSSHRVRGSLHLDGQPLGCEFTWDDLTGGLNYEPSLSLSGDGCLDNYDPQVEFDLGAGETRVLRLELSEITASGEIVCQSHEWIFDSMDLGAASGAVGCSSVDNSIHIDCGAGNLQSSPSPEEINEHNCISYAWTYVPGHEGLYIPTHAYHRPLNLDGEVDLCLESIEAEVAAGRLTWPIIYRDDGSFPGGYATNPLDPDTDDDGISDFMEIVQGGDPNDGGDVNQFLDDDGDGISNFDEVNGYNGDVTVRIEDGPDISGPFYSDPYRVDSDGDGLSDLLERYLKSNPYDYDTDDDLIPDALEYQGTTQCLAWNSSAGICVEFSTEFAVFEGACGRAPNCPGDGQTAGLMPGTALDLHHLRNGTLLYDWDTDKDGLSDREETQLGLDSLGVYDNVFINRDRLTVPAITFTHPRNFDSDNDNLSDGEELGRAQPTNPTNPDSDGDGENDDLEVANTSYGHNPVLEEKEIRIVMGRLDITADGEVGGGEFYLEAKWEGSTSGACPTEGPYNRSSGEGIDWDCDFTKIMTHDELYELRVRIEEEDGGIVGEVFAPGLANENDYCIENYLFRTTDTSREILQTCSGTDNFDATLPINITISPK